MLAGLADETERLARPDRAGDALERADVVALLLEDLAEDVEADGRHALARDLRHVMLSAITRGRSGASS